MADNHSNHICLGIPIPLSVQALPRTPPASFHHLGDLSSLQALKDFGKEFDVPCDEIDQACNLASGPADIVVILQRPKTRTSHNYGHPFPQFVGRCKTLQAVDELIRFATNGARSIHTVTVLDAFSFKPDNKSHIPDERCHQLLAEILRAKKPKVVLRCHRDEYNDPWMKQFELPSKEYKFVRTELRAGGNHRTVTLQSFHPSIAVNNAARRPEYRCLLIYHFLAAFAELSGVDQLPKDAEEIRQLCIEKGYILSPYKRITFTDCSFSKRGDLKLSRWDAPIYLTKALERRYGGDQGGHRLMFADWSEHEVLRGEAKELSTMYNWLEYLSGQSYTFGALGIAEAVLFLWKEHFGANPLYEQVTMLLLSRGSEQQGWFPMGNHNLPVTEDLSKFQISSSEFPGWTTMGSHSPEIFEVNKRAVECISNALALEEGKKAGETHVVHTYCLAACNEIADHIDLVDKYVRTSPLTQLSRALRIQNMATQCIMLAKIIKSEKCCLDEPEAKIYEDLALLRFYLQQLISA